MKNGRKRLMIILQRDFNESSICVLFNVSLSWWRWLWNERYIQLKWFTIYFTYILASSHPPSLSLSLSGSHPSHLFRKHLMARKWLQRSHQSAASIQHYRSLECKLNTTYNFPGIFATKIIKYLREWLKRLKITGSWPMSRSIKRENDWTTTKICQESMKIYCAT